MRYIFSVLALFISLNSYGIDCPAAKITQIQPQVGSILFYAEGQNWHRLGATDGRGVPEMYSALLAAMMSDKRVIVRYPDGYDCTTYNTTIDAQMVRVYKN